MTVRREPPQANFQFLGGHMQFFIGLMGGLIGCLAALSLRFAKAVPVALDRPAPSAG